MHGEEPGLVDEAAIRRYQFQTNQQAVFDDMMDDDRQHSAGMEIQEDDSYGRHEREAEEEEARHQLMLSQQGNRINER